MDGLRVLLLFGVLFQRNAVEGSSLMPEYVAEDMNDDMYARMRPDDDIFVSRRRDDPVTDEQFWADGEPLEDNQAVVISSVGGASGIIDSDKLPANYQNTTSVTKKIGNLTVTINTTIKKTTNPKTGASSISITRTVNSGGKPLKKCTSSPACGTGHFCQKMFADGSYCTECSALGDVCNDNAQCCGNGTKNALCVRGTCQNGFTKGQAGTICNNPTECDAGLCCARRFLQGGECKSLAKLDESCSSGASETSVIMNGGLCPCIPGLVCTSELGIDMFGGTCSRKGKKPSRGSFWSSFFDDMVGEDDDDFNMRDLY